jgi:hypothetical protein
VGARGKHPPGVEGEMNETRIALEVRLYEDVLHELHWLYRECDPNIMDDLKLLIRRFEANAYEVTWKRPNTFKRFVPWYERDPFDRHDGEGT